MLLGGEHSSKICTVQMWHFFDAEKFTCAKCFENRYKIYETVRGFSPRSVLSQNGTDATSPTISYHSTIYASLRRPSDNMKLRDLFCRPPKHRRTRNEVQSVANSIRGSRVDLATLPHSEPDLRIGSSILPTSVPSTSQKRESNGT